MKAEKLRLLEVDGCDTSLEFCEVGEDVWIEIENPWSGDTESGFGRSASFTITKAQALELAEALLKWAS
jgi:hypothetical protein